MIDREDIGKDVGKVGMKDGEDDEEIKIGMRMNKRNRLENGIVERKRIEMNIERERLDIGNIKKVV